MPGKVVEHGKIWADRTTRELLWLLMKRKKVQAGVLTIESNDGKIVGQIGLSKSIFVNGAQLSDQKLTGYPALRMLLTLTEGSFSYVDNGEALPPELEQDLKLRMTQLINLLPNLPTDIEPLTKGSTVNRMRALSADGQENIAEEAMIDKTTLEKLQEWEQRSMRWRALVFWGIFVVVSSATAAAIYFSK
jgi:hypothetical protein